MKIYTKTGDSGTTSLICGKRVSKHDVRVEAYGTVDELISWTGLIRDQEIDPAISQFLLKIQDRLMVCAAILAADCNNCKTGMPTLREEDINDLELAIDKMEDELEPLKSFILPGGHTVVSWCHISRNVCRRAERNVLKISADYPVDNLVVKYLNRLSDYLFVLSRKLGKDFKIVEIPWISGLKNS
jgi:cob(I)alamin adenosyltransferase